MSVGLSRRAQVCVAAGTAVTCLVLSSAPALAGGVRGQEWWLRKLHVTNAWRSTRAGGVTVAVLDTGVDPAQADLTGAVITGPDYTNSGRLPGGQFWGVHGTAMASLIAGRGHGAGQAAGMMGIAPAATILSVRVTLESSDPLLADANIAAALPAAIAHGIRYAVNHGAGVIDLPLDPVTTPGAPGAGGSPGERAAVDYALAHHVVLVAPAGDAGAGTDPVDFPAAYPGVIAVGAFNSSFTRASFSSQQPYVTLTAAGDGVIAAKPPTGYVTVSSTSAASAVVAGIVALMRAQFPALRPAQVARALKQSTVYRPGGGQSNGSGAGTVDANRALLAAARMIETVPTSGPSAVNGSQAAQAPAPTPPAVHKSRNLRRTLLFDGGIALAVFLVLAVPILTYGAFRRRRRRAARLAEVRAAAQVPVRRGKQTASVATAQEDYVPAPLSPGLPAGTPPLGMAAATAAGSPLRGDAAFPGSAFPGDSHPGPAEAGWGLTAGGGLAAGGGLSAGGARAPGAGSPPVPGSAAARAIGSHRMGLARPPRISGSPPWEPAPEPAGEVPWGRAPAAAGGGVGLVPSAGQGAGSGPAGVPAVPGGPVVPGPAVPGSPAVPGGSAVPDVPAPGPAVPEISPWDAAAQEAWPGGPSASRPPAPPPGMAGTNGSRGKKRDSNGTSEEDPSDPSRPIYVWNPGASTEAFPALPPDEQGKP